MKTLHTEYQKVEQALRNYKQVLDDFVTYCEGLSMNADNELQLYVDDPLETKPVEAASRLRELIGLK